MDRDCLNIVTLSANEYKTWLTYEFEYLNDAFSIDNRFKTLKLGRFRPKNFKNLTDIECVEHSFNGQSPDALLIDISFMGEKDSEDNFLKDILAHYKGKSFIILKTADPWRQIDWVEELQLKFNPNAYLIHSKKYADMFNEKLSHTKASAYMFPYCFGRRYFNMGLEREFDIGLIGRCELEGHLLKKKSFKKRGNKKLNVFYEPSLSKIRKKIGSKNYLSRYAQLILNLNQVMVSWNSPVRPKGQRDHCHTPFRYVEAPACGAISLTPHHFEELNEYYFPKETYLCCENNIERAIAQISSLKNEPQNYLELQKKAYEIAMGNHQAQNRVDFLYNLIKGNEKVDVRDFYKIGI